MLLQSLDLCHLVITRLVGLRPCGDVIVEANPLVPDSIRQEQGLACLRRRQEDRTWRDIVRSNWKIAATKGIQRHRNHYMSRTWQPSRARIYPEFC